VPAAAIVKVFVEEIFDLYHGSSLFEEDRAAAEAAARAEPPDVPLA